VCSSDLAYLLTAGPFSLRAHQLRATRALTSHIPIRKLRLDFIPIPDR